MTPPGFWARKLGDPVDILADYLHRNFHES